MRKSQEALYIVPSSLRLIRHWMQRSSGASDADNVHEGCGFDDACNYIP